jgi:Protein of unknown function (DUF3224)
MDAHTALTSALIAAAAIGAAPMHSLTGGPLRASGTFDVVVKPLPFDDKAGDGTTGRLSVDKQIHGDLEGTSRGQMLAVGPTPEGSGAYVAIERVSGTLKGRTGTFVLQHSGSMTKAGMKMIITVVPDSGTGRLTGISGTFTIRIEGGKHFYEFEYILPD